MAKGKRSSGAGEAQYPITQANLDRKGKTNKKVKRNPMAAKYLTPKGKELKEAATKLYNETFKKGRRTRIKEQRAKEAAEREAQLAKEAASEKKENFKPKRDKRNR